ncbi:uncharacterized protein LOC130432826 [Triplophysa dalaica]|uniref:uncharacterized protein LOC130432826 n=1 Tax=Triplophysa dalaica TaxID=1582913 RepID=UPI0024DF7521|nr:uncharacterized protein LOC130432826 [Triplophysa dalaica]XP_056618336.1 uncharacterized protein LOC130432826 [Triplophysa dalaica]XP_056618337.1 uncharacterized protein LOC130432826 [Triplophysa dalaica]
MSSTPVDLLGSRYPVCKNSIERISKKWAARTKNLRTIWPENGTFDVAVCEEMEGLIKNYKPKDSSKKREEKRKLEQEVLNLFRNEGVNFLKNMRKIREVLKKDDEKNEENFEKMTQPPPYEPPSQKLEKIQTSTQMPMVAISGDVKIEGQVEIGTESPDRREAEKRKGDRASQQSPVYRDPEDEEGRGACSPDPYRELAEALKNMTKRREETYESMTEDLMQIHTDSAHALSQVSGNASEEEDEEEDDAVKASSQERTRQPASNQRVRSRAATRSLPKGERKLVTGSLYLQDADLEPWLLPWTRTPEGRLRRSASTTLLPEATIPKSRGTKEGKQFPILIKGAQAQYVPWASQDLDGLVARLPNLDEGAGKWIRMLEEETTGKLLALGDIKALLAKCVGSSKLNELLRAAHIRAIDIPDLDGHPFDRYRRDIWQGLRDEFPNRIDPRALKGEQMGEEENPATYIQKQLRKWKQELERDPEEDLLMTTLFRNAVVDAMPPLVKTKLEDVVGLNSKSHKEFCDHVTHAVRQYRSNELKLRNQEKELQRKLVQLQLEELARKKKTQAMVKDKDEEKDHAAMMAPVNVPVPMTQQPGAVTVQQIPGSGPQQPAPIVIYVKPEQQNRFGPRPGQGEQGRQNRGRNSCWGCGQQGHNRRDCPTNPWNTNQQQSSQWQAGQPQRPPWQGQRQQRPPGQEGQQQPQWQEQNQQGPRWQDQQNQPEQGQQQQGPVNPWRGPDIGY